MFRASWTRQISMSVGSAFIAAACQNTPAAMSYQPSDAAGSAADAQAAAGQRDGK
jgi:hypothetical protein